MYHVKKICWVSVIFVRFICNGEIIVGDHMLALTFVDFRNSDRKTCVGNLLKLCF